MRKRLSQIKGVQSVGVKEGLSCVIFRAIVARKTPNIALPSLQHSVQLETGHKVAICKRRKLLYMWIYVIRDQKLLHHSTTFA